MDVVIIKRMQLQIADLLTPLPVKLNEMNLPCMHNTTHKSHSTSSPTIQSMKKPKVDENAIATTSMSIRCVINHIE